MSVLVFDIRSAERRLREAGMSQRLAETQAEIMAESFVHHADKLVTVDYLDARFDEFGSRMEAKFAHVDGQFRAVYWILAVNTTAVFVPLIQSFISPN